MKLKLETMNNTIVEEVKSKIGSNSVGGTTGINSDQQKSTHQEHTILSSLQYPEKLIKLKKISD